MRGDGAAVTRSAGAVLAGGLLQGLALGVAARAWMRLIAEEPELTRAGTGFILAGFALLGLTQALAALGARPGVSPGRRRAARAAGVVGVLPLFVAAGAVMAPAVVAGGLAVARDDWPRPARAACLLVALANAALVAAGIVGSFGGSVRTLAGVAGLLALYAAIVLRVRPTFAPSPGPRRALRPWVRVARRVALAAAVLGLTGAAVAFATMM